MQDEPREAEDREERDGPEEGDAREKKLGVISIIQQNAVIINGRFVAPRDRNGEWI